VQRRQWHLAVVVAGVVLCASSFVPLWATYRIPGLGFVAPRTEHQNAWAAYGLSMQLALALCVVTTVLAAAAALGRGGRTPGKVALVTAAATALLLAWQLVRGPRGSSDPGGYGIERGLLLFTGAALAAAMAYGCYRARGGKPPRRPPFGDDVRERPPIEPSLGE
jgi:hypothetical protein